ncbi:MAG: hypothetical protein ACOYXB_06315 [Bacteroidota bacterium]
MPSSPDKNLTGRTGEKYAVWLEKTNRWLSLEEPAFFVVTGYLKGRSSERIIKQCTQKYFLPVQESQRFVMEVLDLIKEYRDSPPDPKPFREIRLSHQPLRRTPVHFRYRLNGRIISINYGSEAIAYYFHPLLEPFLFQGKGKTKAWFIIRAKNKELELISSYSPLTALLFKEVPPLKRQVFSLISSVINSIPLRNWSVFIHGSAVTNDEQAVVLSSLSGSGKSTVAAVLMNKGYSVLADDFIPVNGKTGLIHALPLPLSIKKEAVPVLGTIFPGLEKQSYQFRKYHSKFSYLLPNSLGSELTFPVKKVKAVFFLSYQPGEPVTLSIMEQNEALQAFIINATIQPEYRRIKDFFNWFRDIPCYSLNYPHPETAAAEVAKILGSKA